MKLVSVNRAPVQVIHAANDAKQLPTAVERSEATSQWNTSITVVPAPVADEAIRDLQKLTKANRTVVAGRLAIVNWLLTEKERLGSMRAAIDYLMALDAIDALEPSLSRNLRGTNKSGKVPKKSQLYAWAKTFVESDRDPISLADKHKGRVRAEKGWELRCLQMYHIPSKPGFAHVAAWLQMEGHTVQHHDVRRFIQSLPASYGPTSQWRVGKHWHKLNQGMHVSRDRTVLNVGEVYQGDGHTIDVYLKHPSGSPRPYRFEITAWMDVRSRYIPALGWSDSESALSTLHALSAAILRHDNVPAFVHVDRGAGFRAKMLSAESVGYYSKMGISKMDALPGNAKGKGDIEGWFRLLRDYCDKRFGKHYCGSDQADESNRRITDEITQGKRELPTPEQYKAAVHEFVTWYNSRAQKALGNVSPAHLWQELDKHRCPVVLHHEAAVRPSARRSTKRGRINLDNRIYVHELLLEYRDCEVEVEYDITDDSRVWVYDDKHRLICEATLLHKIDWLPSDRREEAEIKRQHAKQKRRQKQIDLDRLESTRHLDQTHELAALEKFDALDAVAEVPTPRLRIDVTDLDYLDD